MGRLRYNNALGTLGGSLTNVGTTITFSVAPPFSTLTGGDYIPLVLEPASTTGASANFEIIYLTGYTAGQTTGTISRGQEGTSGVSHANGVAWMCGPVAADGPVSVVVDGLAASPRSVTDWGPLINAALTQGNRRFVFGPFTYSYSTQINAHNVAGIHFQGAGGNATGKTELQWTGTGSNAAILLTGDNPAASQQIGSTFADIYFTYTSGSYTGDLIDGHFCNFVRFLRCSFSASPLGSHRTANSAVTTRGCSAVRFDETNFGDDFATCGVLQRAVIGDSNGQDVVFTHCWFFGPAYYNPDWNVDFISCWFDLNLSTSTPRIGNTFSDPNARSAMNLTDCHVQNPGAGGGKLVGFQVFGGIGYLIELNIDNLHDHTSTNALAKLLDLQCLGSVKITGGSSANLIDFGNATSAGCKKELISVTGFNQLNGDHFTNLLSGHQEVSVAGLGPGTAMGTISAQREFGRDASTNNQPTLSVHGGATGIAVRGFPPGSDLTGIVTVQNSTGSPSSTGPIVDVAFKNPPSSRTGAQNFPVVIVTPISPVSGAGSGEFGDYGAAAAATQPYGYWNLTNGLTQFSIAIRTALPASTTACYAYRISFL